MALKRINKELTDLGRYVYASPLTAAIKTEALWWGWSAQAGLHARSSITSSEEQRRGGYIVLTSYFITVIHRPLAQRVLSEMIWYVVH
jgi:hypothetical protein